MRSPVAIFKRRTDLFCLRIARGDETIGFVPLVTQRTLVFGCRVTLLSPLDEGHGHSQRSARDETSTLTSRGRFFTSLSDSRTALGCLPHVASARRTRTAAAC